MNENVKEFIVDLLNGNGYLDLEELQRTKYDMEEVVNYVLFYLEDEDLSLSSLMYAVLCMAKRDFIDKAENVINEIENEEDKEKLKTIDFDFEDDWELWANGLDNGIVFKTENEELCELANEYLDDLIDETSDMIGFTDLRIE